MKKKGTTRPAFTSPPFRMGFNNHVWEIVAGIPKGSVATYGQIASMIPRPLGVGARYYRASGARWVGQAMAESPNGLPWQRVINSQGKISLRSKNDHHNLQRQLLEAEGIAFDARGRVDLERFQWNPRRATAEKVRREA